MLEEQVFDPKHHDRSRFRCGEPSLDDFLHRYAAQQRAKGLSSIFVLVDTDAPRTILGFYTLSAAHIEAVQLRDAERKVLPRYPIPCIRMGRLACSVEVQGRGIGAMLMGLAVGRCLQIKNQVGAYALLVDAKHDAAKSFYLHYGFTACADMSMTLYLPLGASVGSVGVTPA